MKPSGASAGALVTLALVAVSAAVCSDSAPTTPPQTAPQSLPSPGQETPAAAQPVPLPGATLLHPLQEDEKHLDTKLVLTDAGFVWAAALEDPDGQFVVVNGREHKRFFKISDLTFSADGSRFAYVAQESPDGPEFVVLDGQELAGYRGIAHSPVIGKRLVFSRDGSRFAYGAQDETSRWLVVLDGDELKRHDAVGSPTFSQDGSRFTYAAERDGTAVLVLDGRELQTAYERIGSIVFSPDGTRLAYAARSGGDEFVVLGSQELARYEAADLLTFSSDGSRFAYVARKDEKRFVVLDGREGRGFHILWNPTFSPDGSRFAYMARPSRDRAAGVHLVLDSQESDRYDAMLDVPVFSRDGDHLAYTAMRNGEVFVVIDGRELDGSDSACYPQFTADGGALVHIARRGTALHLVVTDVS